MMDIHIKVYDNKVCYPPDITIGYVGEKNVDKLILDISPELPKLKWYLLFNNHVYPFREKTFDIDERLTSESGAFRAYVLGSNAMEGKPMSSGSKVFHSDMIMMRVR